MTNIIYKITYLPHLNTNYPKYYIGSKYNYGGKNTYYGSVSSNQIFEYTEGISLKNWWKEKTKNNNNFLFDVLETFDCNIKPNELIEYEKKYHIKYNVLCGEYFNQSIATMGFCSVKKSNETKRKMSEITKKYWDSPAGLTKKKKLIERNKLIQSDIMKEKWKNPSEAMINMKRPGAPKGTGKGLKKNKKKRKCLIDGIIYENAESASMMYEISPTNIRRRCRMSKYKNWSYFNE